MEQWFTLKTITTVLKAGHPGVLFILCLHINFVLFGCSVSGVVFFPLQLVCYAHVFSYSLEPSGPPTITATKASSDSIYLRWSPPPLEDQNGIITGYVIDSLSNRKNISVSVNLTEHILEAFPYTGYQLRVAALNSVGQGPFSGVVNVETLQDGMHMSSFVGVRFL